MVFISLANANESKKLVTFDYAIADTLSVLHQPPFALSGLAQYQSYFQVQQMPDTYDLGLRHLPNFELLAALHPSSILISPPFHLNIEDKLSRIANVVQMPIWRERDGWSSLEQLTIDVGELIDEQLQAQELIDSVEARLAEIATQIERPAEPLLIVEIRDHNHVRLYGHGSLEDAVLKKLGLENAWQGPTNNSGFSTLTIPEAFQLEGRIILLHPSWAHSQDLTGSALPTSGIWQYWLDSTSVSVKANYWPWGGFPSALRFAESLKEALENT